MPIAINGTGTITGLNAGGLPDGCITTDDLAANAVNAAKLGSNEQSGLCKAWVNFNGTGTVAIRASYNVSSITDGGAGIYTVNFTNALADGNHVGSVGFEAQPYPTQWANVMAGTSTSVIVYTYIATGGTAYLVDPTRVCVAIFR